jgi:hypothetical protein
MPLDMRSRPEDDWPVTKWKGVNVPQIGGSILLDDDSWDEG